MMDYGMFFVFFYSSLTLSNLVSFGFGISPQLPYSFIFILCTVLFLSGFLPCVYENQLLAILQVNS